MRRRYPQLFAAAMLISLAVSTVYAPTPSRIAVLAAAPRLGSSPAAFALAEPTLSTGTTPGLDLPAYLSEEFCAGGICRTGSAAEWVITAPDSVWTVEELQLVHGTLLSAVRALDEKGLDGRAILSGYRFRRSQGPYVPGKLGQVALVRHNTREIWLADRALSTQSGFHIYHELGHVVDRRLDQALTREFQRLTLGEEGVGGKKTADGFWLDRFARDRPEEATADAFALWIILNHTSDPEPVFWNKPEEAPYDMIAAAMNKALRHIADTRQLVSFQLIVDI